LEKLLDETAPTNAEHKPLTDLVKKVSYVAEFINNSQKQLQNHGRMVDVQNRIGSEFDLFEPHRILVREADVLWKRRASQEAHLFLFNDIVLWTAPAPDYNFFGYIKLVGYALIF